MSTLATLKADIAEDLDRTDLTSAIASEINNAIRFYQPRKFYFNESRGKTITTVADQTWYTSSDDADIGLIKQIDGVIIETSTYDRRLDWLDPQALEVSTDANSASQEPDYWTYYNQQIGFYPVPDGAYTMRLFGTFSVAAPASDGEADNPWMTEAYDLIRHRVLSKLYLLKIKELEIAAVLRSVEEEELKRIVQETGRRQSTGKVAVPYL